MKLWNWIKAKLRRNATTVLNTTIVTADPDPKPVRTMHLSDYLKERLNSMGGVHVVIEPPRIMPGVAPQEHIVAMDSNLASLGIYAEANSCFPGLGFMGYPFLAELTQKQDYRKMSERPAAEMVRKWIKFKSRSKDKSRGDRLTQLENAFERHGIRDLFRQCAVDEGFYGRSQLYIDTKESDLPGEKKAPLLLNQYKIRKGSLRGFKKIEPIVTYPYEYNASDPLRQDYFKPRSWFVMGQQVHASRLLMFQSRPVPDLLKPAYNFGGMSMSQLAIPYVENWETTRDAVARLVGNFSKNGIATDLSDILGGGSGTSVLDRLQLYTKISSNDGLMVLDKEREEFFQFNTPLSGLDKLQAQAQEHMASCAQMPLIIMFGISPAGLNATADPEIRVFYDYIHDQQEIMFRGPLETIMKIIQLDEFGEIDPDITFDFEPLYQMDPEALARIRKSDAEASQLYIQEGVLDGMEVRQELANNPDSGYNHIDADAQPTPPTDLGGEAGDPDQEVPNAL